MRDPAEIYTRKGTPLIAVITRTFFFIYFIFLLVFATNHSVFPHTKFQSIWTIYLVILYGLIELLYNKFRRKNIDLTFALPLVFAVYMLDTVTLLLGGQEALPLMNRAEHFIGYVLITYIVWIFFIKYLPHNVWRNHPYYTSLLVLSVSSTLGVFNELIELFFDTAFSSNFLGYCGHDTSLDLLMNTLGGGVFLIVRLIIGRLEEE